MDNKTLKGNLKAAREKAGLTQDQMAELLKVSRITYNKMENGKTKLINEKLLLAAGYCNTAEEEIILGYDPGKNDKQLMKDIEQKESLMEHLIKDNERLQSEIQTQKALLEAKEQIISQLEDKIRLIGQIHSMENRHPAK